MRNPILIGSLAAVLALPLIAAPDSADAASCRSRKTTGTILGGVGGALLGGAVTHGSAGPIIGGLGGAVVGHEVGRSGCRTRTVAYRSAPRPAPRRTSNVYYDQYGRPISSGSAPAPARYTPAGYASCRTEMQAYYDERGALVQRPMQVCDR